MVLVNGEQNAAISAQDRGLHYGDGVFETLAVRDGRPLLWGRHIARLNSGCQRLGIPMPDAGLLFQEALQVCDMAEHAVLKIIITRGSGGRGYRPSTLLTANRLLALYPVPDYPLYFAMEGVFVRLCSTRLACNPALAGIKHLNRLEQVLARSEWADPAIPEGIMLDGVGRVIEGTMSNIFAVRDGVLMTPDLSECGVAGIMRGLILEIAGQMSIPSRVTTLTIEDMMSAQELFLCNSLIGVWPVNNLAGTHYCIGALTRRIADYLHKLNTPC